MQVQLNAIRNNIMFRETLRSYDYRTRTRTTKHTDKCKFLSCLFLMSFLVKYAFYSMLCVSVLIFIDECMFVMRR